MQLIQHVQEYYRWAMEEQSDPRTSDWLLISRPWTTLGLTLLYLFVVTKGQHWMAARPAFDLKPLLLCYNFSLVILSAYMCYEFFVSSFLVPGFSLVCQPIDHSDHPNAIRLASVVWWYFFSKIIEFLDTIIFVLRKKNNQISFLHVYHHSTMVILWWIGTRFAAGGEAYFGAMLNCFIHVLMYSYYFLSACGPSFQKYLWWKKYMTAMQLGQFTLALIHTLIAIYANCGFPRGYEWALVFYLISHILLFSNFYHKTYLKKKSHAKKSLANGSAVAHANGGAVNSNGNMSDLHRNGVANGYTQIESNGVTKSHKQE